MTGKLLCIVLNTYYYIPPRSIFETTNRGHLFWGVDDDFVLCLLDFRANRAWNMVKLMAGPVASILSPLPDMWDHLRQGFQKCLAICSIHVRQKKWAWIRPKEVWVSQWGLKNRDFMLLNKVQWNSFPWIMDGWVPFNRWFSWTLTEHLKWFPPKEKLPTNRPTNWTNRRTSSDGASQPPRDSYPQKQLYMR